MLYLILIGSGRRSLSAARLTTPPHGGRIGRQAGKAKTFDPDFKTPATNLYGANSNIFGSFNSTVACSYLILIGSGR